MDINTYSVWGRTTDTDMVLGSSPGPDIIIALVGIADPQTGKAYCTCGNVGNPDHGHSLSL